METHQQQHQVKTEDKSKLSDSNQGGTFHCKECKIEETYHYKGQRPPFCRGLNLLEISYVARDPFTPPGQRSFLLLGSDCTLCGEEVCQDSACSVFYTKRFCQTCAKANLNHFPNPIQTKINANN